MTTVSRRVGRCSRQRCGNRSPRGGKERKSPRPLREVSCLYTSRGAASLQNRCLGCCSVCAPSRSSPPPSLRGSRPGRWLRPQQRREHAASPRRPGPGWKEQGWEPPTPQLLRPRTSFWGLAAVLAASGIIFLICAWRESLDHTVFSLEREETRVHGRETGLFQEKDSCNNYSNCDKPGTRLQSFVPDGKTLLPELFQTSHLLFYERFRAYQDYILADCKASEVREFTAEFLEKVLEPSGWRAVWHTNVFKVLVEVTDVDFATLKAVVKLADPYLCESEMSTFTLECIKELLELKEHRLPLQELWVVFDDSGAFDQTALAIEHVRFFYQNIWRSWDEEEEDEYDYFVRCVEPRLRLHYDILEDRVPSGLIVDYHSLLSQCEESYRKFLNLRSSLSNCGSDSEQENISMVEGLKLYSEIEQLKQKLKLIENPLLRYVFGHQKHSSIQAKGVRPSGQKVTHVVSPILMASLLQSLLRDRLCQEPHKDEMEIQFHSDPWSAVNASYEGDTVIVCPGHYVVHGTFSIADAIVLEGYGLPDDIVIEKRDKNDTFVECTGTDIKISGIKFVQHGAVEGILIIHHGKTTLENCVLQCETTGVTVRTSAEFLMKNSDLYGAKGAGIEIYPGSKCILSDNEIHHCKEGILIKDFLDEHYDIPKISMVNNVIHNNEGYAVVLVKPTIFCDLQGNAHVGTKESKELKIQTNGEANAAESVDVEELIQCATGKMELYGRPDLSEQVEGNCEIVNELVVASMQKGQKKKRLSELGITEADDNLMSQEMFISILGNQFKWNGKGSFGTFLF